MLINGNAMDPDSYQKLMAQNANLPIGSTTAGPISGDYVGIPKPRPCPTCGTCPTCGAHTHFQTGTLYR